MKKPVIEIKFINTGLKNNFTKGIFSKYSISQMQVAFQLVLKKNQLIDRPYIFNSSLYQQLIYFYIQLLVDNRSYNLKNIKKVHIQNTICLKVHLAEVLFAPQGFHKLVSQIYLNDRKTYTYKLHRKLSEYVFAKNGVKRGITWSEENSKQIGLLYRCNCERLIEDYFSCNRSYLTVTDNEYTTFNVFAKMGNRTYGEFLNINEKLTLFQTTRLPGAITDNFIVNKWFRQKNNQKFYRKRNESVNTTSLQRILKHIKWMQKKTQYKIYDNFMFGQEFNFKRGQKYGLKINESETEGHINDVSLYISALLSMQWNKRSYILKSIKTIHKLTSTEMPPAQIMLYQIKSMKYRKEFHTLFTNAETKSFEVDFIRTKEQEFREVFKLNQLYWLCISKAFIMRDRDHERLLQKTKHQFHSQISKVLLKVNGAKYIADKFLIKEDRVNYIADKFLLRENGAKYIANKSLLKENVVKYIVDKFLLKENWIKYTSNKFLLSENKFKYGTYELEKATGQVLQNKESLQEGNQSCFQKNICKRFFGTCLSYHKLNFSTKQIFYKNINKEAFEENIFGIGMQLPSRLRSKTYESITTY